MKKNFINLILLLSAIIFSALTANAANWISGNSIVGNVIYFDTDSIQKKENAIFYTVKYYENNIKDYSKVLIMSEGNHPFVLGDPIAFKDHYFMANIDIVNRRVMDYIKDKEIPEISPDNDLNYLLTNLEPYAESVIAQIKQNLKYRFSYRNSYSTVLVKINKQGEVKKVYVQKSSGNQKLNKALLQVIEKSSPFEPLPEEYDQTVAILWINVSFGPDKSIILMNSAVSLGKMLLR